MPLNSAVSKFCHGAPLCFCRQKNSAHISAKKFLPAEKRVLTYVITHRLISAGSNKVVYRSRSYCRQKNQRMSIESGSNSAMAHRVVSAGRKKGTVSRQHILLATPSCTVEANTHTRIAQELRAILLPRCKNKIKIK